MKNPLLILMVLFTIPTLIAQKKDNHTKQMEKLMDVKSDTIKIAVLLYDDVTLMDFAGPMEVLSKANKLTGGKYQTYTVGLSKNEIATENSMVKITPDFTTEMMPKCDYLIIPGASMPVVNKLMDNEELKSFILNWKKKKKAKTISICTAAYLLANTGALNNKKATTHYFVANDFERLFPSIDMVRDVRFVDEGSLLTSSGVTSGIDVALHLVEQNSGTKIKDMIARAIQYNFHYEEKWPVAPNGMEYRRK